MDLTRKSETSSLPLLMFLATCLSRCLRWVFEKEKPRVILLMAAAFKESSTVV